ncbi:unnamed protein product [Effrenium voratum]|uniref:Uncharacterized protein n=1 Tax=Effrenium voratum TaxID=2562239 RepID=A0AA36NBP6_9DINO|nr:unnamed protein product [Effrenium voratum]
MEEVEGVMKERMKEKEGAMKEKEGVMKEKEGVTNELVVELKEKYNRLVQELAEVKAVYATRPLLELALTRFMERNPDSPTHSWTAVSEYFLDTWIFDSTTNLPQQKKLVKLNKHFHWSINAYDDIFLDILWHTYGKFSEKHHGCRELALAS